MGLPDDDGAEGEKGRMELVATTGQGGQTPTRPDEARQHSPSPADASATFFTNAQWSADGTSIVASSFDHKISVFVLPQDLLEPREDPTPRTLVPQSTLSLPEPTGTVAPAPYYSLQEPTSQLLLVAYKDHPIHLYHAFPGANDAAPPLCGYKLIKRETEEYITPASLLWTLPGTHFLAGSANRLDYFDVSRPGSCGPVVTLPTIPSKRHRIKGGGVGMKGVVSALAAQRASPDENGTASSLVAAGTRTRWVGLYDLARSGSAVANWSIAGVAEAEFGADVGGRGIVQTLWSPCGRYLVFNERSSRGLLVYDVRVAGRPASVLVGRAATSPQRLACDVFPGSGGAAGFEVWAGTETGEVLVWEGVGAGGGAREPTWRWAAHGAPVGATAIHASGSVVATCSGSWVPPRDGDLDAEAGRLDELGLPALASTRLSPDRSLRIWAVGSD